MVKFANTLRHLWKTTRKYSKLSMEIRFVKRDKRNRSKQRLWWISNLSHGRFLDRKILRYVTFFAFLPINLFFPNSKSRLSTNNILNINIAAFPNLRIFLFFFIAYFMVFLACTRYCGNIVDATNLSAQLIQRHAFHFALHRVILSKHDETHGSSSVI